ncbi:bifunctional aspartate kinase/homoserine dehydrogenase I [Agrilutibacter solisilvae]|uniref:Bifunctional aspartokinase/homoserine dehydrogenase n=1 Tax=Agrilutibacter solisilvae TaxID=2763317 RepID=A0A974Y2P6_9GAMM|nr:bifunctional aspartate kinase/homoserine dehydrogenase I [Lysobacter solisilvae]QSX79505.1 bifunctional aspartate kinase/homoserine dehydrogenase I [Lysobacter solisilvae]
MSLVAPALPQAEKRPAPPASLRLRSAHKFGGSSLADAARFRNVATLLADAGGPGVVVVSAMQGITDALTALANAALADEAWLPDFQALRDRHLATAQSLDPAGVLGQCLAVELDTLHALLQAPSPEPHWHATVQGLGEVLSSHLLHAVLGAEPAGWARLDARDVLVVHAGELGMAVDWDRSQARLARWRAAHPQENVVITGFIARDGEDRIATLGRNGSDYSAAIFAVLFGAGELTIWTDVDGVLSADPRLVPDAVCLASMSYAEACELAYFGAKVLHPQTMAPAMQAGLPILIRNTLNPAAPGTRIARESAPAASPVKGLSLVHAMAVLELSGAGLIGVPGTAERLFAALREARVSVTMITQGSSEHTICCLVRGEEAEAARVAVAQAFAEAIADGQVEGVTVDRDVAVLAAVGDGMVGTHGVAARLFHGLAQARVNIRAIAQGASERNISVVVDAQDAVRGLRAAHAAFWLSPQTLSVGLIGPGKVGRALLGQLAQLQPRYSNGGGLDLRLRAIANSRQMHLAERALDPAGALDGLDAGQTLDLTRFAQHVRAEHLPHALIVDCSGSDEVAAHYPQWLAAGIHVVTPNKHAGSGPLERYRAIRAATRHGGHFRYEATVGAGLPVIQTLRCQLDTGDELTHVDGVLSGTLAWLFNRFDGSQPFSQLVREASERGYTEPDPRDDLSGIDVARKLVILAREAGRELAMEDVEIESLVPPALRTVSREQFLARLDELDAPLQARLSAAQAQGRSLRYLAQLDAQGRARVGLVSPEPGHASLHGALTDNLIQFRTRRYADNPLVVQGPGAGPEVTAAGVFGDVLAIAQALGARL